MKISDIQRINIQKHERAIFFLLFLVNLFPVLSHPFVPSLDGPQHLCTSNVIAELCRSNELMGQYFALNRCIVGNWTGHFFLSLFNYFFSAPVAETLLVLLYYTAISLAFRFLVFSIAKKVSLLSLLIIPFSSTTLLLLGYYNFCFATIFFFLSFGYWHRIENRLNVLNMIVFALLLTMLFLSHTFVYSLFGLSFGITLLVKTVAGFSGSYESIKAQLFSGLRKTMLAFIAALPSLYLWLQYYHLTKELSPYKVISSLSIAQLLDRLYRLEILMGFHHIMEAPPNTILLFLLAALILCIAVCRFLNRNRPQDAAAAIVTERYAWFAVVVLFLGLYFVFPDKMISGNISNRIAILFFFSLIVWLNLFRYPSWLLVLSGVAIVVATVWHRNIVNSFFVNLNSEITELLEVEQYIKPNTVVYPVVYSHNWMHPHFGCYVGSDMPVVNLANPQCTGQFPVVWNYADFPNTFLGGESLGFMKKFSRKIENLNQRPIRFVDYVVVFGKGLFEQEPKAENLRRTLQKYYRIEYVTSGKRAILYSFRYHEEIEKIRKMMENKPEWMEEIAEKAETRGIPVENMMTLDALYMIENYY